jgi:hypothetical protein
MSKPLRDRLAEALSTLPPRRTARWRPTCCLIWARFRSKRRQALLPRSVSASRPWGGSAAPSATTGSRTSKANLKNDMGDQPWLIGDRLRDLRARTQAGEDQLTRGLELEMAALVAVYEAHTALNSTPWSKRLATAGRFTQRVSDRARAWRRSSSTNCNTCAKACICWMRPAATSPKSLAMGDTDAALVIFEARRYSRHARLLAAEAVSRRHPRHADHRPLLRLGP